MKINMFNDQKRTYVLPMLEVVPLDNEISLSLVSDLEPPIEPTWSSPQMMDSSPLGLEVL